MKKLLLTISAVALLAVGISQHVIKEKKKRFLKKKPTDVEGYRKNGWL
jgi:hypothetical protein